MTEYHSILRTGWDHFRVDLGTGEDHVGVRVVLGSGSFREL